MIKTYCELACPIGKMLLAGVMLVMIMVMTGCSTTSHLPYDEILYTGVDGIDVNMNDTVDQSIRDAVNNALEVEPNSSLFGSAYKQSPFPFGLWIYNGLYTERDRGLRHWIWNKFKSNPTLVSQVNPVLRCKAAEVAMSDEGYFDGHADFVLVPNKRNERKAKIHYNVNFGRRSDVSSVEYLSGLDPRIDSIVAHTQDGSVLVPGKRFSASDLNAERSRIRQILSDSGYYAYSEQYVRYLADSTGGNGQIALRVINDFEADSVSLMPCRLDSIAIKLDYGYGLSHTDVESSGFKSILYRGNLGVKPKYLFDCLAAQKGQLYNPNIENRILTRLNRLNTFKYNSVEWEPLGVDQDTVSMLMRVYSTYIMPWSGSVELKGAYKDNNQVGPGLMFEAQRRNIFGGGELLSFELNLGYEWNTGKHTIGEQDGLLNSYEFGGRVSIAVPRLQLPFHFDRDNPVTTTYSISANVMRRSGFFQMMKTTFGINYSFSSNKLSTHTITPFQLTYTSLISSTAQFQDIVSNNRVLKQSFANIFIPSIRYTYLFDNTESSRSRIGQWIQFSVCEAGGLIDFLMGHVGSRREQGERQLLWQKFSQFAKVSLDVRNYTDLGHRHVLATRLFGGLAYAYGNSTTIPYSEQFFIGGSNSLRGFSIRGIGPGRFDPGDVKYAYMDRTGDVKLEANVEWRFPIVGILSGALFADAGNIWALRDDSSRSGGQFTGKFYEEVATDAGLGLRLDLGMLVVRGDVGVPIHDPSEHGSRYYNTTGSFFGNLGYHFSIGYPF
ncbi:MAG: BamA/TamA family outer membrane protein [Bacteroidales bacterium]|nr:BamA/TamA family outer membrane protein [Candidatus Liminaster caballi]